MSRKVKFCVSIGLVGCKRELIVEVDDDASDEELSQMVVEWALSNVLETWFEEAP